MHISGRGQPCSLQRAILYHPMWTPDTIRWIHGNHPSAMNASDIDQDLGQSNAYQKHGVPFCIQAERKALQRKLEALQSEQKLHKLMFDPRAAKGCGRPSKPYQNSNEHLELKDCFPFCLIMKIFLMNIQEVLLDTYKDAFRK